jgi:predicted nucleic acid-binding Zn ribbon protein
MMGRLESLRSTATDALRHLLDAQPNNSAKMSFAWRMAAGPALAKAADPEWRDDGVLVVHARTAAWLKELRHARPILSTRLEQIVGSGVIKKFVIE